MASTISIACTPSSPATSGLRPLAMASPKSRNWRSNGSSEIAIGSLAPFERQFLDFGDAIAKGRPPLVSGEEGYQALEVVEAVYRSCRTGQKVVLG